MENITFWALAAHGNGISGGDRIFIEFARRWSKKYQIHIFTSAAGEKMLQRLGVDKLVSISRLNTPGWIEKVFIAEYAYKVFCSIYIGAKCRKSQNLFSYSCSEFPMDVIPGFIHKIFSHTPWVCAWYQTAPNPIQGFGFGRYRASALYYWLLQLFSKPLISQLADMVMVNNDQEKKSFPKLNSTGKLIVILGAVNISQIVEWQRKHPKIQKKFTAVFQGRFHPQKGILELLDIWRKVVNKLPDAKLVMIGDGPLMNVAVEKIKKLGLQNKVILAGYVFDGDQKYSIFAQSKCVVHPALYDSGGMASAEAMAFGLPCIGFDLPSYNSYYKSGMVKVKLGDIEEFSKSIIRLLTDEKYYKKSSITAKKEIKANWSWDVRATTTLKLIEGRL